MLFIKDRINSTPQQVVFKGNLTCLNDNFVLHLNLTESVVSVGLHL